MTTLKIPTLGDMPSGSGQLVPASMAQVVCIEQSPQFVLLSLVPERETDNRPPVRIDSHGMIW